MSNEEYEYVKATVDDFWGWFPVVVYNGCEHEFTAWSEGYIQIKSKEGMRYAFTKDQIDNSILFIKKKKPTAAPSKKYVPFNRDEWIKAKNKYEGKIFQKDNLNTHVNVFLLADGDIVFGHDKHNMAIATKEEAEEQLVVLKEKKERWVNVYYDKDCDVFELGAVHDSEQAAKIATATNGSDMLVATVKVEV